MEPNYLRIFIAFPISLELQQKALEFQKKFKNLKVRWIKPENLHITLVPPWYEKNTFEVIAKLKTLEGNFDSFVVNFDLIEYGPTKFRPRLIWAKGETPQEILKLQEEILKCLNKGKEERPFKLHLTLARFDKFNNNLPKLDIPIFWEEKIKSFVLMRSHLLKTGAEYEILQEIKLK